MAHPQSTRAALFLILLMAGCVTAIPAKKEVSECELWSREWELNISKSYLPVLQGPIHCAEPECLLVVALSLVAIPVTSFVVSGSIVVVGNTVHWIEEQGTCEDSMIQESIDSLVQSTESAGGVAIQSGQEFIDWVKRQTEFNSNP